MAGLSRTLKLSILGDVDGLNKSLKTASGDVDSFGSKVGKAGVAIGKAFAAAAAAAGAAAIAIGIEGVKAAIADEKAQTQLAVALENATGATVAQVKATEDSILQMSLATGVADDELRPALGRLVRSTGDITKAQDLLSTALDISAATGKPLETIANSLGKAYEGNTTALGKLGIGIDKAELKTMSFQQVQERLTDLFGGAAARNADTYAGRIARVQVAFDEAKETVGAALLPILDKLLQFINQNALPAINAFSNAFSLTQGDGLGKVMNDVANTVKQVVEPIFKGAKSVFDSVKTAIMNSKDEFAAFWDVIKFVAPLIGKAIGDSLRIVGDIAEVVITIIAKVLGAIKPLINFAIEGINLIIKGYNLIPGVKDIALLPKIGSSPTTSGTAGFSGTMPGGQSFSTTGGTSGTSRSSGSAGSTSSTGLTTGGTSSKGVSGVASASQQFQNASANLNAAMNKVAAANFIPDTMKDYLDARTGAPIINLTVNGAMDKEGTARTIVETLNNSFYRGTGGATAFATT
jgi:phage-related protein